jgi:hypothetical protein
MMLQWIRRVTLLTLLCSPLSLRAQAVLRPSVEVTLGGMNHAGGDYVNHDLLLVRATGIVELVRTSRVRPLVLVSLEALRSNAGQINVGQTNVPIGGCACGEFPSLSGYAAALGIGTQPVSRVDLRSTIGVSRYGAKDGAHATGPVVGIAADVDVVPHLGVVADYRISWSGFRSSSIRLSSYAAGIEIH